MLLLLLVVILLFSVLTSIPYAIALSMSLLVRSWNLLLLQPIRSMSLVNCKLPLGLPPVEVCGAHGVFPVWSSLGTSWTEWMRICIPDGCLLLSWRTPLRSRGLHCWSSHIVPEWLEPVLPLCWSFWRPATGLHVGLCQMPSLSLWSCGSDRAGVIGASLKRLGYRRSVLLCSSLV